MALTPAQKKYTNSTREALGILWALKHFRYYVHGRQPIVFCDCKCLSDIMKTTNTSGGKLPDTVVLRDWVARLLHYEPQLVHKPGKLMAIPDTLSRHYAIYQPIPDKDKHTEALQEMLDVALDDQLDYITKQKIQRNILKEIPEDTPMEIGPQIRSAPMLLNKPQSQQTTSSDKEVDETQTDDTILSSLATEQRCDPQLNEIIQYISFGTLPRVQTRANFVKNAHQQYFIDSNGVLRKNRSWDANAQDGTGQPPAMLLILKYTSPP